MKKVKSIFLSLFALTLLASCTHTKVKVPNTRVCAVAGVVSAGADCAYTLSAKTEEMTLDEFLDFLEPQSERPDPLNPGQILPARGAALCQSAEDFGRLKQALDIACVKLKDNCDYEMKTTIRTIKKNIESLQRRVTQRRQEFDSGPKL